jgi:hypothetical protein
VPANHAAAEAAKIERPTAKPLHTACAAASAKLCASASSLASRPSRSTPRQCGSWRAIAAAICRQAVSLPGGGSFHQSGRTPAA